MKSTIPDCTVACSEVSVRAIFSKDELLQCAEEWKKLCRHPNADWDMYWHINGIRGCRPCILELREQDEIRALWIGRIHFAEFPIRIGYFEIYRLRMSCLDIITGGVLGDDSERSCRLLLERALQVQKEHALDVLTLSFLPTNHRLARLAGVLPPWICRGRGTVVSEHWTMSLPSSYAEFLRSRNSKHRWQLKRIPRILEEAFPGQIRIRMFQAPEEVEQFCRDADAVAQTTYQHRLGEAFRADDDYRKRCRLLAGKGALRGCILYVGEEPKAYWMVTAFGDTLLSNLMGYDPAFRRFRLGIILLLKLIEDHCGSAFRKVDFGHGGAVYKERYGDESFKEATFFIYRRSVRGVCANCVISVQSILSSGVKSILSQVGILQRVKTLWRKGLSL